MNSYKKIKVENRFSLKLDYDQEEEVGSGEHMQLFTHEISATYRHEVHSDLLDKLDLFIPHLIVLCEAHDALVNPHLEIPDEFKSRFEVTGISFGGDGEHAGVVIIGKRKLNYGKILNLVSPFTKFEDEHCPYMFAGGLYELCAELQYEVDQYLQGKHAPIKQLSLDF